MSNKGQKLVPVEYRYVLEALSKAALADMVWSLAGQTVESGDSPSQIIAKLRSEWGIVAGYRGDSVARFERAIADVEANP